MNILLYKLNSEHNVLFSLIFENEGEMLGFYHCWNILIIFSRDRDSTVDKVS